MDAWPEDVWPVDAWNDAKKKLRFSNEMQITLASILWLFDFLKFEDIIDPLFSLLCRSWPSACSIADDAGSELSHLNCPLSRR